MLFAHLIMILVILITVFMLHRLVIPDVLEFMGLKPIIGMRLVMIFWEDSRVPRDSWEWIKHDIYPKCTSCQSVGFVVAETESAILLAPTIGHEDDGDKQMIGGITIAKRQIVKTICLSSSLC